MGPGIIFGDKMAKKWYIKDRCKSCNNRVDLKTLQDPKKDFCDKCYFKLGEFDKFTIILELDINIKHTSAKEIIEYLEDFSNYTKDIDAYAMRFKGGDT